MSEGDRFEPAIAICRTQLWVAGFWERQPATGHWWAALEEPVGEDVLVELVEVDSSGSTPPIRWWTWVVTSIRPRTVASSLARCS